MLKNKKSFRQYLQFELPALGLCIGYGVVVILLIMPMLQESQNNLQLSRYAHLGSSATEIIHTLLTQPQKWFSLLFENTIGDPLYDWIKTETYCMLLFSGGICLLLRPYYLIMLIPVFTQKLCSNHYGFWGINGQYSIEFVPILSFAVIDVISKIKRHQTYIISGIAATTLLATLITMSNRVSKWHHPENICFYQSRHYETAINIPALRQSLERIDKTASLSVSSVLAPHLAFRKTIYHFPHVKDAAYIVLLTKGHNYYPLSETAFFEHIETYRNHRDYTIAFETEQLVVFKKR